MDELDGEIKKSGEKHKQYLLFHTLDPFEKMNKDIYRMTSEFPELLADNLCLEFFKLLNAINTNTMKLLNNEEITTNTTSSNTKSNGYKKDPHLDEPNGHSINGLSNGGIKLPNNGNKPPQAKNDTPSTSKQNEMSLPELIEILMLTDIRPIEYDRDLLVTLLITNEITNENVLTKKDEMLRILEDCKFPANRAKFTYEQIEKNFGKQSTADTKAVTLVHSGPSGQATEEEEDESGIKVIDLTMTAIEGIFEGSKVVHRYEIQRIYKENDITSNRLVTMTETEFTALLKSCQATKFYKHECVQIHRLLKTFLNEPQKCRYDIDIGLAVIYIINEGNVLSAKDRIWLLKPETVLEAFNKYSAKEVMEKLGRKRVIEMIVATTPLKKGPAGRIWATLRSYIEDSNVTVPERVIIRNYKEETTEFDASQFKVVD